ncbi:ABC transporter ATP-binding protein [Frankia sp. Mgl5]|uniref:dipeptide ABC transporter ATP-binding protein n=1 Tax=Frankia sp. Mgl5 TaxID=2933793 RepID=UPI00200F6330|nr:ABC transporter ATP-binding protein [Frankia sp. Mgl5]MCK9926354.1 ABC transporter ATP-binding protein [Frankia sp. Mgl5]
MSAVEPPSVAPAPAAPAGATRSREKDPAPLLVVDGLDVTFTGEGEPLRAVRGASFTLAAGQCLAIVGESGSGKSVTARTLVGLTGARSRVTARTLTFDGLDLTALTESRWRAVRGAGIGLVLQDALVSLDPLRRVGAEIGEVLRTHRTVEPSRRAERVLSLLADVGVPDPGQRVGQYSHQLSGGLRQRALIASAIAARPRLLLADEPTTALDATVQRQILALLDRLRGDGTAILLISHDLAVVAGLADHIVVMYAGLVVESGPATAVLDRPRHPYTRALLAAVPALHPRGARLSPAVVGRPGAGPLGCPYAASCARGDDRCRERLPVPEADLGGHLALCWHPFDTAGPGTAAGAAVPAAAVGADRPVPDAVPGWQAVEPGELLLDVAGVSKRFRRPDGGWRDAVLAASLQLRVGEAVGVVGESGSGKTTLARIVLGFQQPDEGVVTFGGLPWSGVPERERRDRRRQIQAVYQDPLGSFDPRHTVGRILGEAVEVAGVPRGRARRARVAELLDQVGLPAAMVARRPRELSGGQRQRVAIARALAPSPRVLVCDEPVSALDVSIQAQILDLLTTLRRDLGVALMFISHDLGVIHHVSDRLLVMKDGRIVEAGDAEAMFRAPDHPYTRALLAAVPGRGSVSLPPATLPEV